MLSKGVINLLGHDSEKQEATYDAIIAYWNLCTLLSTEEWAFAESDRFFFFSDYILECQMKESR